MVCPGNGKALFTAVAVPLRVTALSGLTKKSVYADKLLATILDVKEGSRVSYADLTRGLHKYIKDHNLRNPEAGAAEVPTTALVASGPPEVASVVAPVAARTCRECEAEIPAEAIFCDLCGARQ